MGKDCSLENFGLDFGLIRVTWNREEDRKWNLEKDYACMAVVTSLAALSPGETPFSEVVSKYLNYIGNAKQKRADIILKDFSIGWSFVMRHAGSCAPRSNTYYLRAGWRGRFTR